MRKVLLVMLVGATVLGCGNDDSDSASRAESVLSSVESGPEARTGGPVEPPAGVTVDYFADGTALDMVVNQRLVVRLPADPSTGAVWGIERVDVGILTQVGDPYYRPEPTQGEPGVSEWAFRAARNGTTELVLTELQPGAKPDGATPRYELTVNVRAS